MQSEGVIQQIRIVGCLFLMSLGVASLADDGAPPPESAWNQFVAESPVTESSKQPPARLPATDAAISLSPTRRAFELLPDKALNLERASNNAFRLPSSEKALSLPSKDKTFSIPPRNKSDDSKDGEEDDASSTGNGTSESTSSEIADDEEGDDEAAAESKSETSAKEESSFTPLRSAMYLEEEQESKGATSIPGWVDGSSDKPSIETVSHLQDDSLTLRDPSQLLIDSRKLAEPVTRTPSTWHASFDLLAASRLDEELVIRGPTQVDELGTGANAGARLQLANRFEETDRFVNAWDVIVVGLSGEDRLDYDPYLYLAPDPFIYSASLASFEANAIHRRTHRSRVRQQFLGIRYIDHRDSIEREDPFPYMPGLKQQSFNRMLGLQVGLDQCWDHSSRLRFGWGAKAGVFYNAAEQTGYLYNGTSSSLPLMVDCHADLAWRVFQQAYLGIGISGLRLEEQSQSRFAWQAPTSTHQLTIIGMQMGFDVIY